MMMMMMMTTSARGRRRDERRERTDNARDTQHNRNCVHGSARAGNGINECPGPGAYTHSLVSTRARHNGDYEPHTGGDDTSRTHRTVRRSQPRPTNRQAVSGDRRHEIPDGPCCGSGRRTTEARRVGFNGSDQLTAGPRADWPLAGSSRDCSCRVYYVYVRRAAASASAAAVLFPKLEPRSDYWRVSAPRRPRKEGIAFKILALGVWVLFYSIFISLNFFFKFKKYLRYIHTHTY